MRRIIPIIIAMLVLCSCASMKSEVSSAETPDLSASEITSSPSPSGTETPGAESDVYEGELIAKDALQYEGYKYVYGAENPDEGFDCSGLVYYVYRCHGYRLNRVADDQARLGEKLDSLDDLLPGDLLCFFRGNYCGHIGIYLGNGQFIHALDSARGVIVADLCDYTGSYNVIGRRIVGYLEVKSIEQIEAEEEYERQMMEEYERLKKAQATPSPGPTPEHPEGTPDPGDIYVLPTPTPPVKTPEPPEDTPEPTAPPTENPDINDDSDQEDPQSGS